MAQKKIERLDSWPEWFTGKTINEPIFCREFLERHKLAYTVNSFFTTEARVTNACGKPFISSWSLSSSLG